MIRMTKLTDYGIVLLTHFAAHETAVGTPLGSSRRRRDCPSPPWGSS